MANIPSDSDDELGDKTIDNSSAAADTKRKSKHEKSKRREKKRRDKKKSRMLKDKLKLQMEKVPPPDHFLNKLPAEIRNQIYEYVLDPTEWHIDLQLSPSVQLKRKKKEKKAARLNASGKIKKTKNSETVTAEPPLHFYSIQKSKRIESGNDGEPPLLRVCPQIRDEALGIYFRLNTFVLSVSVKQLLSLERWISSVFTRYNPKTPKVAASTLTISLKHLMLFDVPLLLPVASIVQSHHERLKDVEAFEAEYPHTRFLERALRQVVKLGNEAAAEDWHEDWLSIMFDEWLYKSGYAQIKEIRTRLRGDCYGMVDPYANDSDEGDFPRFSRHFAGTSDRVLRSRGQESRVDYDVS